jgi:hypothetical protein
MGWVVNAMSRRLYPREREQLPILQEAGRALEPVWTDAENLVPTGIRSTYCLPYSGRHVYSTCKSTMCLEVGDIRMQLRERLAVIQITKLW